MPQIRPVSDLRNHFADISKIVHESSEPIFLTKNGYGDMVVMSLKSYERRMFDDEIYLKLKEAELEAVSTNHRLTHNEVFATLKSAIDNKVGNENV